MERLSDNAIDLLNALQTERLEYSEYVLLMDAATRLAEYEDTGLDPEEIKAPDGWISVEERLPDTFVPVIVCRSGKVEQGQRDVNGRWKVYGTRTKSVTHWMPLPDSPKVKA